MSKPKIVSLLRYSADNIKYMLASRIDPSMVEVVVVPQRATEDEMCQVVAGATVILSGPVGIHITRRVIEVAKGVRLIQFGSVGYEGVDLEAARELGVPVANNPGWNAVAVAEHTLMFMLVLLKKALYAHQIVSQGQWKKPEFWNRVWELKGKTMGILGLGTIGKEVARRARAFGPQIIYNKRTRLSPEEEEELGVEYRTFDQLLEQSDILTVHVPLTEETRGMIGKNELSKMKNGAILINTSRVEVVDESALAEAVREGKLSGSGIDVPRPSHPCESPLIGLDNVMLTPHIAGATKEALAQARVNVADNIVRVLAGDKPLHVVNDV